MYTFKQDSNVPQGSIRFEPHPAKIRLSRFPPVVVYEHILHVNPEDFKTDKEARGFTVFYRDGTLKVEATR